MLLRLLTQYPHLSNFLARSGLSFLAACRVPSTLNEIMRQSGLSQSALYLKLKQAKKSQIIIKNKKSKLNFTAQLQERHLFTGVILLL